MRFYLSSRQRYSLNRARTVRVQPVAVRGGRQPTGAAGASDRDRYTGRSIFLFLSFPEITKIRHSSDERGRNPSQILINCFPKADVFFIEQQSLSAENATSLLFLGKVERPADNPATRIDFSFLTDFKFREAPISREFGKHSRQLSVS